MPPELMARIEGVASQLDVDIFNDPLINSLLDKQPLDILELGAIVERDQLQAFMRSRLPLLTADAQLWWVWAPRIDATCTLSPPVIDPLPSLADAAACRGTAAWLASPHHRTLTRVPSACSSRASADRRTCPWCALVMTAT